MKNEKLNKPIENKRKLNFYTLQSVECDYYLDRGDVNFNKQDLIAEFYYDNLSVIVECCINGYSLSFYKNGNPIDLKNRLPHTPGTWYGSDYGMVEILVDDINTYFVQNDEEIEDEIEDDGIIDIDAEHQGIYKEYCRYCDAELGAIAPETFYKLYKGSFDDYEEMKKALLDEWLTDNNAEHLKDYLCMDYVDDEIYDKYVILNVDDEGETMHYFLRYGIPGDDLPYEDLNGGC